MDGPLYRNARRSMLVTIALLLFTLPFARRSYTSPTPEGPAAKSSTAPVTVATEVAAGPSAIVATSAGPVAAVAQSTVDIGEVPQGKSAHFKFLVRNNGGAPLEMTSKTRCGCTVVRHARTVPPGGEATIETELNTDKLHGVVQKLVDLHTNDSDHPRFELVMKATVLSAVEIQPGPNPVFALKSDGPTVYELRVRTRAFDDVQITQTTCSVPYATAELEARDNTASGRLRRLKVTIGPEARFGRSNFVIMLSTTAESQREIPISVRCEKGIVTSETIAVREPTAGSGRPATGTVALKKAEGPFQITRVTANDPQVEAHTEALKEGSLYRLTVTDRRDVFATLSSAIVTVETDDVHQPRFEFAVRRSAGRPTAKSPSERPTPPAGEN